mgnify:CR=1 FL=1
MSKVCESNATRTEMHIEFYMPTSVLLGREKERKTIKGQNRSIRHIRCKKLSVHEEEWYDKDSVRMIEIESEMLA